ncbi:hypothetical protein, partial [Actinomadura sp. BRA 177]|uniref:hypothetical protein n=1 Tax=Actinomadura sp. BRA 177 TaxID=2745202 RepID=UPI0017CDC1F4
MRPRDRWMLAGGRWSQGTGEDVFSVDDPATGEPLGVVAVSTPADVATATTLPLYQSDPPNTQRRQDNSI